MNAPTVVLEESIPLPEWLGGELRSDHAGEWGAVMIYRGMLAVSRDAAVREFAREHLAAEELHLSFFRQWLPARLHSRILPLWCAAGWMLGALSALGGRNGVYRTVVAVETFVDEHYAAQIEALALREPGHPLLRYLRGFREDEIHHRKDAAKRLGALAPDGRPRSPNQGERLWAWIVDKGSRLAVGLAKRV